MMIIMRIYIDLTKIRENNDLSQRKLAVLLNVSKSTYDRWETQEQIIPLSRLNEFCNFFNVSMHYVIGISKKNFNTIKLNFLNKNILE